MAASGTSGVTTKIRTKEDAEKQTEQFFQKHDNVFEPILDIIEPGNAALVREWIEALRGMNMQHVLNLEALGAWEARAETAELVGRVQLTNAHDTIKKLTAEKAQLQDELAETKKQVNHLTKLG
jgi:hypothetical protein